MKPNRSRTADTGGAQKGVGPTPGPLATALQHGEGSAGSPTQALTPSAP